MKSINNYIVEKLKINKSKLKRVTECTLFPKDKYELIIMIKEEMKNNGNECSLNHIDVSEVINMNYLFCGPSLVDFNGDISGWDTSNVERMAGMFSNSKFNNDSICDWDVSNVKSMALMFHSNQVFNQNINDWDVSNVTDMEGMFCNNINFNQPLDKWDVSSVTNMGSMFEYSIFNQDISKWDVSNVERMEDMFCDNKEFNQPIGNWNVKSVKYFQNMFKNALSFDQDLSSWKPDRRVVADKDMLKNTKISRKKKCKPSFLQ
jgi:surface protein